MPALVPTGCGGSKTCIFPAGCGGVLVLIYLTQLYTAAPPYLPPSCKASVVPFSSTCASGLSSPSRYSCPFSYARTPETLSASAAFKSFSSAGLFFCPPNPAVALSCAADPSPASTAAENFCPDSHTDISQEAVCALGNPKHSIHKTVVQLDSRVSLQARTSNVSTLCCQVASHTSLTDPTSSFSTFRSPCVSLSPLASSRFALPANLSLPQSSLSVSSRASTESSATEWSVVCTFLSKASFTSFTAISVLPSLIFPLARSLFAASGCRTFPPSAFSSSYTIFLLGAAATGRLHFAVAHSPPSSFSVLAEFGLAHRAERQQLSSELVSTPVLHPSPQETGAVFTPFAPVLPPLLLHCLYTLSRARSATARVKRSAVGVPDARASMHLFVSLIGVIFSLSPAPPYVAAHPQRRHAHLPPLRHNDAGEQGRSFALDEVHVDAVGEEDGELTGDFLGASQTGNDAAATSDGRTLLGKAQTIRPRRRVPGRRSSAEWQQLFPDLRLVDVALPATLHSALTDVNSVKYFELAVAQKVPVSRQLLEGIRMFDVRAWRDALDGRWYSEVPWRLEDDLRQLREYAPAAEEASSSNFVTTMLRSLPPPLRPQGGKDRGRKMQPHGSDKRSGGVGGNGGGAGSRKVPPKVLGLVDLHSWTTLEDGLFKPIQDFLRTHLSEVAVVVISSFNGNRKTAMNAVPHGASLASSLQRLAARQQQRQQEGTAAGSSSTRLEGHPFYEDVVYRRPSDASTSGSGVDGIPKQQQNSLPSGNANKVGGSPVDSIPVLSPEAMHNSPAFLDSHETLPAAYEVQDPLDTTSSFYMSSAVRKPLTYADVASFLTLVDKYWGQLLPRHSHVFFGPADDLAYFPPSAAQTGQASPAATSPGEAETRVGTAAAVAATSLAGSVPPGEPASGGPAASFPSPAVLQQAPWLSMPRLLSTATHVPSVPAVDQQIQRLQSVKAEEAAQKAAGGEKVLGASARATDALEREAFKISEGTTHANTQLHSAANVVTPIAPLVGGAAARNAATPEVRAAAFRPPAPTAATSASTHLDTPFVAGESGATAAVFSSGLDNAPDFFYATDRRQVPTGRPPPSVPYRVPEALPGNTLPESGTSQNTRGASAEQNHFAAAASLASQINSYPMYESLHRPETFAEWLRAQGDLLLAKATLKDLVAAKIRLLLFVDDPLIAWYITVYSREHVVVFVAADHVYDVLYKSEALFAPCALPHRASNAPNGMLLSVTREATWAGCRERCESTPGVASRPEEGQISNKMRQARNRAAAARGATANSRSCTYWTFEPSVPQESLSPFPNLSNQGGYFPQSPADIGLLPFTSLLGGKESSNQGLWGGGKQQEATTAGGAPATIASGGPTEMNGECRTYTGPLALADTVPLHGSIIQPRSCSLRTLYELPTQWASAAVFADLTDAVCPIFEIPGSPAGAMDGSAAGGVGDAAYFDGMDAMRPEESKSFQFLPELCMLDATPRSLNDALHLQDENNGVPPAEDVLQSNLKKFRGMGLERKLLRVYFAPPSPVPFVDGTRGGKREVGPVDAVTLMNELTATWALWQLERQQLLESLTVIEPVDPIGMTKDEGSAYGNALPRGYPVDNASQVALGKSGAGRGAASVGIGGSAAERSSSNAYYGGSGPPMFLGRERPRSTRPVNALMVMRYDQTKSLVKIFSHLSYFEIVMNMNPQPRETGSGLLQGSDGWMDFSVDRYVKVTALLNSLGLKGLSDPGTGAEVDDTTEEEKRAQIFMMWLAICAAIVCFIVAVAGSLVRSVVAKRVPSGGWTAAVTPHRTTEAGEPS